MTCGLLNQLITSLRIKTGDLTEAIKDKGGDVTAVETALRRALKNNPNLDEQAITDQISSVLNTKVTPQ